MQTLDNFHEHLNALHSLSSDSLYEILFSLKNLSDDEFDIAFPSFKKKISFFLQNDIEELKPLKDIYFVLEVFRPHKNDEHDIPKFTEELSYHIPNFQNVLKMIDYPNFESTVYAVHDGLPIFQILKNSIGSYDAFYYLGETEDNEFHYAFTRFDKSVFDDFNEDKLTLFDLYKKEKTLFYFQPLNSMHYEAFNRPMDFDELFSNKITCSFFASVWGDRWQSVSFPFE